MNKIGERLKQLRDERGYSQREWANIMQVTQAFVSKVESGESNPNYDMISLLKTRYPEVNLEWLFTGTASPQAAVIIKHELERLSVMEQMLADKERIIKTKDDVIQLKDDMIQYLKSKFYQMTGVEFGALIEPVTR